MTTNEFCNSQPSAYACVHELVLTGNTKHELVQRWITDTSEHALGTLFHCGMWWRDEYSLECLFTKMSTGESLIDQEPRLLDFIEAVLTRHSTLWEYADFYVTYVLSALGRAICAWRPDIVLRMLHLCATIDEKYKDPNAHLFGYSTSTSGIIETTRVFMTNSHIVGVYAKRVFLSQLNEVMKRIPDLALDMGNAGLPLAQLFYAMHRWHIQQYHVNVGIAQWYLRVRVQLHAYLHTHHNLWDVLSALHQRRRFRLPGRSGLWDNMPLLRLICAYMMDYSEKETAAVLECLTF